MYEDPVRELLQDATKDNKLGDLEVDRVVVGKFISTGKLQCLKSPRYLEAEEIIEDLILQMFGAGSTPTKERSFCNFVT